MARKNDLRDIVGQLRRQGHRIIYKVRKDGSIRITSIDGRKFSSRLSQGNMTARAMAGKPMSERALHQRRQYSNRIRKHRIPKKKRAPLSPELKKAIRRAQRVIRKATQGGKTVGTISTANVRHVLENEGEEAAINKLERAVRYFQGYAYEENVDALLMRVHMLQNQFRQSDAAVAAQLERLYGKILAKRAVFREAWINPTYTVLYDIERAGARGMGGISALINSIDRIIGD